MNPHKHFPFYKRWYHIVFRLPKDVWILFLNAVCISAYMQFGIRFIGESFLKKYRGKPKLEKDKDIIIEANVQKILFQINNTLKRVAKYTPWKTECYTLALTGKYLLKQKNINSLLYIGFRKKNQVKVEGHAWLVVGDYIVTGNLLDLESYQINGCFK